MRQLKLTGNLRLTLDFNISEWHPTITDWIARVEAKGGSVSNASAIAHNNFVNTLISNNLWTKLSTNSIIFTYGTNALNGLEEPLVKPSGVTPTKHNWGPDYSLYSGLDPGTGNISKYINTGYNLSNYLTSASAQISTYLRSDGDGADGNSQYPLESACTNGTSRLGLSVKLSNFSGNSIYDCWGFSGNDRTAIGGMQGFGLISGARVSTNDARIFRNGSQVGSTNLGNSSTSIPNLPIYLFADNNSGVATNFSRRIHSYDYIGPGLTASEEMIHYNAVQALQTNLGRAV